MPKLLSGSTLRRGGSGEFIDLKGSQPQLPPTPTTSTGYSIVTDSLLRTSYRSSLGNIEFSQGQVYSNLPNQNIQLIGTGSSLIQVLGGIVTTSTTTGALVVDGGIGVGDTLFVENDITVNRLTVGQGYEGYNNIVLRGTALPSLNEFNEGQKSIAIGYDTLLGLNSANRVIAIGRYAVSTGTLLTKTIAIGDSALKNIGVYHKLPYASITGANKTNPVAITAPGHDLTSGTSISIDGVVGMTEINTSSYYAWVVNSSTIYLYSDLNLTTPVNGTGFGNYTSGGTVYLNTKVDFNIAIGDNAATNLINGELNTFIGTDIATNLTTGSYNVFVGHEVGNNIIEGTGNISIGGDNLVNGLNDQISIGSAWYYNGGGYSQFNSDLGVGLGTHSTGTNTGAFNVLGGVGITDELYVGGLTHVKAGMIVDYTITGTVTTATNLEGGITGSIPYQSAAGSTQFIDIGAADTVLTSNGTTATWQSLGSLTAGTSTYANSLFVNSAVPDSTYYLTGADLIGDFALLNADSSLTYVTTTATTSSYFVSGTSVLNVPGSIYSIDGNNQENNLLYTPKVTVSNSAPSNPRVGDFWINPTIGVELQYINDGGNKFWIQFTGL